MYARVNIVRGSAEISKGSIRSYRARNTHNLMEKLYPYFLFHRVLYEFPMNNFNLICFRGEREKFNKFADLLQKM